MGGQQVVCLRVKIWGLTSKTMTLECKKRKKEEEEEFGMLAVSSLSASCEKLSDMLFCLFACCLLELSLSY